MSPLLWTMSPLCGCFVASATLFVSVMTSRLLAPTNVHLTSYNMDLCLKWSPPENETCLYSTQLLAASQSEPRAACVNTSALHCELSHPSLGLHILEFGRYKGSVRAQCGAELSPWVHSQTLLMDNETVIGPPNVTLASNGAEMEVIVRNPEFHISTMTDVFGLSHYNICYWPRQSQNKAVHVLAQQNRVVLSDLEPWTEYCVQVRVHMKHNPAEASEPVCASTKDKPSAPWLAAVLTFFALALAVTLVVISVIYHKRISHFLCPKDPLPEDLQDLQDCPHSRSHLMPQEEVYHQLSVVPAPSPDTS